MSPFAKNPRNAMETIVIGIISVLLFVYLFVAVIRPEKF
jgi:K+-transporting ATPase KdpF subunit